VAHRQKIEKNRETGYLFANLFFFVTTDKERWSDREDNVRHELKEIYITNKEQEGEKREFQRKTTKKEDDFFLLLQLTTHNSHSVSFWLSVFSLFLYFRACFGVISFSLV